MGFEPTTTEFHLDALTYWAIRPWVQFTFRANFLQLLEFHHLFSVKSYFCYCLHQSPRLFSHTAIYTYICVYDIYDIYDIYDLNASLLIISILTHSLNLKLIQLFKVTILMLHQQSKKLAGLFILVWYILNQNCGLFCLCQSLMIPVLIFSMEIYSQQLLIQMYSLKLVMIFNSRSMFNKKL